jgi:hypothetical protein
MFDDRYDDGFVVRITVINQMLSNVTNVGSVGIL